MATQLPCPTELWTSFSNLLDIALDLSEKDCAVWLASLPPEHHAVRPWLEKVLAADTGRTRTGFLDKPTVADAPSVDFTEGKSIGPYLLKRRLGSGGMGEVWLAARADGNLNRQIALKLPHVYLLAGVQRKRFDRERDILAALSHPHIAQLYDAGIANGTHPYLAMEWIDGDSITRYCEDHKPSINARIDLFLQVLDAVGYAHARLIAHRDIKPSNIMVTGDGQVKLLDFGIAKLLSGDVVDNTVTELTQIGGNAATPAYAAPEQLAGEPVTVAVDLYALGVVLYELLTGQRPFRNPRSDFLAGGHAPRASSQVRTDYAAQVDGLSSAALRRALGGDLDAILGRALQIDPQRRYPSAAAFAEDLQNSRSHRPIVARRIGAAARAFRFVRRHRMSVALAAGLVLALIAGSGGILWQSIRARQEADRAIATKDFLIGVFQASDPRIPQDKPRGEITARELLDISTDRIESGFPGQPRIQAELLGVSAEIYNELDESKRAAAAAARQVDVASSFLGATDPLAIQGLITEAYTADRDNDDSKALALLDQADPLISAAKLDKTAIRARWQVMRGEALMSDPQRWQEAQQQLKTAVELFAAIAPKDPRYADALNALGDLMLNRSEFAQAADYFRNAIAATPGGGLSICVSGAWNCIEASSRLCRRQFSIGTSTPNRYTQLRAQ